MTSRRASPGAVVCPCVPNCPTGNREAGASAASRCGARRISDRTERDKVTNDPVSCVPVLGPCPVLSAGNDNLPQASYRGQWRKWDTAGRGQGSRPRGLRPLLPARWGSLCSGGLYPSPCSKWGGGRCTGLHHWDWALAFKGKASCISEGAVPEKQKTAKKLLGAPPTGQTPPAAWLLRRQSLTTGAAGFSTSPSRASPHTLKVRPSRDPRTVFSVLGEGGQGTMCLRKVLEPELNRIPGGAALCPLGSPAPRGLAGPQSRPNG